jgi:hypothetical protein
VEVIAKPGIRTAKPAATAGSHGAEGGNDFGDDAAD